MMFRTKTRRGIRAVQAGGDPTGLCRDPGMVIPTYCNDTVLRMPPDMDPEIDRQRMRETGRRLAESYLKDPPLLAIKANCELTSGGRLHAKGVIENSRELDTSDSHGRAHGTRQEY
jgi:hypothetical protein